MSSNRDPDLAIHSPQVRERPLGPFSNVVCWHYGHEWQDDGFMGDSRECARCWKWQPREGEGLVESFLMDDMGFGMLIGTIFGLMVGITLTAVILA